MDPLIPPISFTSESAALGVAFDDGDVERIGVFLALLIEANTQFNLTRIVDPEQAWSRHVLDSLTLLPFIDAIGVERAVDVGSGGGVPGIPLAVVMPHVSFTLLEATGKKTRFLERVAAELGLVNVSIVNDRAEDYGRAPEGRERFDAAIARAVGRLPVLLELTVPLLRVGGMVLAIKGDQADTEIAESRGALHRLHARVADTQHTSTGTVVVVEKLRPTPKAYPRRAGEPKREPLS